MEAKFMDIHAAADYIGPGAVELPNYIGMIREVCQPQSDIQRAIREVPATGHPSRYFVETAAPTRREKSAYLKAIVCPFVGDWTVADGLPVLANRAVRAVWALHCNALLFGSAVTPDDANGVEYCGLARQLDGSNALETARAGLVEYHWLSDPLPRLFQLAESEGEKRFVVVKFGALVVKPAVDGKAGAA